MAHDDQFTATGPPFAGSGVSRSAFSSRASGMVYGANVQGDRCGVVGESVRVATERSSMVEGLGVYGFGENLGVMGNGNRGLAGVLGVNNRGRAGVIGATMRGGTGVYGGSLRNFGNPLETFARLPEAAAGGTGIGVHGVSGDGYGVLADAENNAAVVGRSITSVGVWGTTEDGGYGVLGEGRTDPGVVGRSDSSVGVWGHGQRGVLGTIAGDRAGAFAGHFVGPVFIDGDLMVAGLKGAAVRHPDGSHRLLCAVESPESWFEDFGEATLKKGRAQVPLNADFAALVNLENMAYHVFLSPYADTNGLYVAERTAKGFVVREQRGGSSSGRFGYRIVAKRKGVRQDRLAKVALPPAVSLPAPPAARRATGRAAKALPKPDRSQPSRSRPHGRRKR